jgi:hypothetical protein
MSIVTHPVQKEANRFKDLGYPVVPCHAQSKAPTPSGWETTTLATSHRFSPNNSVGIVLDGAGLVDLDIEDEALCEAVYGRLDPLESNPCRIGREPRKGILFKSDNWPKFTSKKFKSPDGKTHQIEVLGKGQQCIAHGIHPITNKPYYWTREIVPIDQLPAFTREEIEDVIAFFEDECEKRGWEVIGNASTAKGREPLDPLENLKQTSPISRLSPTSSSSIPICREPTG